MELFDAKQRLLGRRHLAPMLLGHVGHEQHVGAVGVEIEPARDVFAEHGRREGPEGLTIFHLQVQQGLHGRRARIAEDRARSEGARAELHASLEPADRFAVGQRLHGRFNQLVIGHRGESGAELGQTRLDLGLAEGWAEVGAVHGVQGRGGRPGLVPKYVISAEGRAQGATGVSGCRLDPHALEAAVPQDFAIRHAVERDATGEAEILCTSLRGEGAGEAQQHFLGNQLDRGCEIQVALGEKLVGLPRRRLKQFVDRGEPIVCTPEDAFRCFMGTEIELLVAENYVLKKGEQAPRLRLNYKAAFTPD